MLCRNKRYLATRMIKTAHLKARPAVRSALIAMALAGLGHSVLAQAVEFRIVEMTGQTVVTPSDAILDFAVQARVTGGSSLGGFGMSLVIVGEPDTYGAFARDRIMSAGGSGTYYTGAPQTISTVGQGGLAAQFGYLAGISPSFNGAFNTAVGTYTNDPGSQEINAILGAAAGSLLLQTPGIDTDSNGLPDTWSGNAAGLPAQNGDTAPLDPTVAAGYFGQGQFIDVYRFQYTATNLDRPRILHIGFGSALGAQVFTELGYSNGLWKADTSTFTGTITATGIDVPVRLYAGIFGDLNADGVVDCTDLVAAVSAWGHIFGDAGYRVELDYDFNGTNDAADKSQFDAVCSCTHVTPSCDIGNHGWIGGANPLDSTLIRAETAWAPQYTNASGALVAKQPVVGYDSFGAGNIATWNGASWTTLAEGVNGTIDALIVDTTAGTTYSNKLVAAGSFSSIGGVAANNIAYWDGTAWHAYAGGINGRARALCVFGGVLYVGGEFTSADGNSVSNVAVWNGTSWSDVGGGTNGPVLALGAGPNGLIVAGGGFTSAGGTNIGRGIAGWDGTDWIPMGSSSSPGIADGAVECILRWSSTSLIVGGSFSLVDGVSNTCHIAKWDGSTWSALGTGLNGSVHCLTSSPSGSPAVVAGGEFTASGTSVMAGVARWQNSAWGSLGTGIAGVSSSVQAIVQIPSLEIILGGRFTIAGSTSVQNWARWSDSGKPWIAIQPTKGQDFVIGGSMNCSVTPATAYDTAGALTYQWKRGSVNLADGVGASGEIISGSTSPALSISNVQSVDRGIYTVTVTNSCGFTTSTQSTLGTCAADHNGNGVTEVQDVFDFINDWLAGCIDPIGPQCKATADFNNNDGLEIQDIFDFLSGWFAGCP